MPTKRKPRAKSDVPKISIANGVPYSPSWRGWSYSSAHTGASATWNVHNWVLSFEIHLSGIACTFALGLGPASGHVAYYF